MQSHCIDFLEQISIQKWGDYSLDEMDYYQSVVRIFKELLDSRFKPAIRICECSSIKILRSDADQKIISTI